MTAPEPGVPGLLKKTLIFLRKCVDNMGDPCYNNLRCKRDVPHTLV